jgi:aerobic C4-dicarboxylate transport protein
MELAQLSKKLHQHLYVQVLTAITLGILLGFFYPETAIAMKPLGDGFIKLIKMIIAPIIFCTVVTGIAGMQDMDKVGRVGVKALLYFEVVSTMALIIGLLVVHVIQPGVGMNVDVGTLDTKSLSAYTSAAKNHGTVGFLLNLIPTSVVDAFAKGDILQVLLFSLLFGFSLAAMKETGAEVVVFINKVSHVLFGIVETIMKLAPIGAFGAMAFTIGKYGIASLAPLAKLMGSFYLTCLLFIFIVLGLIARYAGFSILKFIIYIKDELLIVLGTSARDDQTGKPGLL